MFVQRLFLCLSITLTATFAVETVNPDPETLGRYGGLAVVTGDGA